ncbi:hypothetical protein [Acinetobacter tibetensis]|uniref:Phage antitermination protein Q n=1 Tax=Acinetobacter tibetensis TaxID=2943497 RepID=A0AAE9LTK0_9GAMM|nr:hypothetical protein [Acinetobacter tibetensis]USE84326.1 hypothetical protein M5E07_05870 [Acinetobacter tibetensis]
MNVVAKQEHILQAVDWTRFDLEGWLYQFGAWMNSVSVTCGKSINPIAIAMDSAVKAQKYKKLTKAQQQQIIVDYLTGDFEPLKSRPSKLTCQIDDNEARAVQRLILDMLGQSEIMDDWMDAIIDRYFYGNSWAEMVTDERSQMDARMDVKCGLAALHCRYGFIGY